jgi:hypothetical protein
VKRWGAFFVVLGSVVACLALVAGPAFAQTRQRPDARLGELSVRVVGLPSGQAAALLLTGPPQHRHGPRLHRRLAPRGKRTRLRLAPGRYRLSVSPVTIRRRQGLIEKGATARPERRHLTVTVVAGRTRKATARYGSILNPGIRDVTHAVARVLGPPTEPSAVVLKVGTRVRRGQILSSHPTAKLPHGLLARVLAVSGKGRRQAVLRGADIYEVAPTFSFDVPVMVTEGAGASRLVKCASSASEPGASPFVRLDHFHVSGGWTTSHFGFISVKTGATAELHFDVTAGVSISTAAALKCALSLPSLGFQGMAGPIPVYGGVRPGAEVSVSAAASLASEGTAEVTIGVKASGVPPAAVPILGFSTPKFKAPASVSAEVKAGLSLGAELGVGAENAANLHVDLTNGVEFSAKPGECSWDLTLGAFSATGEVGPLSISTPSTPALRKNLWHAPCGAPPPPPPPPPAPTPPPVTTPTLPLTRAVMTWDSDADVDLYTWDEFGDLLYYGEREGIPGAELLEDVIPSEGETEHPPEVFVETESPDRPYTFGICDYHRDGGLITLEVIDPDGAVRTFHEYLAEEGEGLVVTTSPLGIPYEPEPGWCHYSSEFAEYEE